MFSLKTGVETLIALGVRTVNRGAKEVQKVQAKYVAQAEEIGRDAFRLGRTDRNGQALPDSGRLMFGHEKAVGGAFMFAALADDLFTAGYKMADVNILREDHRDRLFVNFKKDGETVDLQPEAKLAVEGILRSWWINLQGFRNPDGRWTINVSGYLSIGHDADDKKIVRMNPNGTFRLLQIRQPTTTAPQPTTEKGDRSFFRKISY
ncbi:hypothetical protein HYV69_02825 [Candidatus Uhrbacteria bacterium]|nr:hypothetical protein [Candidatus Uhrbacteria bacterium]